MNTCARSFRFGAWPLLFAFALTASAYPLRAAEDAPAPAETNIATAVSPPPTNNVGAEIAEANRQMMEKMQREIESQVTRHTEAITSSLSQIEPALNRIRQQQEESSATANRTILMAAGLFAVAGFFGLGFLTLASVRAMGRFTEVAVNAATRKQLPPSAEQAGPPAEGDYKSIVSGTVERASARFQGALEQLERRILELEHTSHPGAGTPGSTSDRGGSGSKGNGHSYPGNGSSAASSPVPAQPPSKVELQLGRGQALLKLDQAAQALECFESVLAEEPENTDALVRKGMALEKLQDWDRALECYDRAIELDDSLTVAFLYKGGVCNRLERHREALESYEQALRSEQKRVVAP